MTYLGRQKTLQTAVNADEVLPSLAEQLHDLQVELHSELAGLHSVRGLLTCKRRAASGERRAWIGEQGAVKLVCRVCLGCEIINKKSS